MEANNWDSTDLGIYLKYDSWEVKNGLAVLAGQKYGAPDESSQFRKTLKDEYVSQSCKRKYSSLCNLWEHSSHAEAIFLTDDPQPLLRKCRFTDIIQWALSKDMRPDWLDWAIERDLYPLKQEIEKPCQTENPPPYSTSWLSIQQAAISEFFNPRRNPDAKRDEIVEWINKKAETAGLSESDNIANAIFTIIKPKNHDPKKKRV